MADLNSTIVRGNLRVTDNTQVNGSISEGGTLLSDKYQAKLIGSGTGQNIKTVGGIIDIIGSKIGK